MNKSELRKIIINKRNKIPDKEKLSTIIVDKVLNLDIYRKAKVIALYNSMNSEVDTSNLIKEALNDKIVLLPRIINNKIEFIMINRDTTYTKSNFNILEPIGDVYKKDIDLIIVPGVAFDRKLNRLGFGMGYYDRYLKDKNIYKIGICFSEQLVDLINVDDHDIKMDLIITEKDLF